MIFGLLVELAVRVQVSDLANVVALGLVNLVISVHHHLAVRNVHLLPRLCHGLKKACNFMVEKGLTSR